MTTLTLRQVAWLVESGESTAWRNYYTCAAPEFSQEYGVRVQDTGSAWITMVPRAGSWFFNRINGLDIAIHLAFGEAF